MLHRLHKIFIIKTTKKYIIKASKDCSETASPDKLADNDNDLKSKEEVMEFMTENWFSTCSLEVFSFSIEVLITHATVHQGGRELPRNLKCMQLERQMSSVLLKGFDGVHHRHYQNLV